MFLTEISKEFALRFDEEQQKNNKLSLYIKKEFVNTTREEKDRVKKLIIDVLIILFNIFIY